MFYTLKMNLSKKKKKFCVNVEQKRRIFLCTQVKVMHVTVDDVAISPPEGFLVRKGPGHCHFDFAQEILFIDYLQASERSTQANR